MINEAVIVGPNPPPGILTGQLSTEPVISGEIRAGAR